MPSLSGDQFSIIVKRQELASDDYSPGGEGRRTSINVNDVEAGYIEHTKEGFVQWVEVDPRFRRRGIGRALLTAAGAEDTSGFTEVGAALWKNRAE